MASVAVAMTSRWLRRVSSLHRWGSVYGGHCPATLPRALSSTAASASGSGSASGSASASTNTNNDEGEVGHLQGFAPPKPAVGVRSKGAASKGRTQRHRVMDAELCGDHVTVRWSDGTAAQYHNVWLR